MDLGLTSVGIGLGSIEVVDDALNGLHRAIPTLLSIGGDVELLSVSSHLEVTSDEEFARHVDWK